MTPNMQVVNDYVKSEYSEITRIGVTNCRKISGSQTYSQHSWSNANDFHTYDKDLQDEIAADLTARYGDHIRNVLTWRYNSAHASHVHVDMWPKGWLTPPCEGAALRIKYSNGTVTSGPFPSSIKEDEMAILTDKEQVQLQKFLANLESINSNVSFVNYMIPWFRERDLLTTDEELEAAIAAAEFDGVDVDARAALVRIKETI